MLFKKKHSYDTYDAATQIPILHASICTGETAAGFKNKETGKFEEVMLISSQRDLEEFKKRYGITEDLPKEY